MDAVRKDMQLDGEGEEDADRKRKMEAAGCLQWPIRGRGSRRKQTVSKVTVENTTQTFKAVYNDNNNNN